MGRKNRERIARIEAGLEEPRGRGKKEKDPDPYKDLREQIMGTLSVPPIPSMGTFKHDDLDSRFKDGIVIIQGD